MNEQVDAIAAILRRVERPRAYAGDWEADTARRILAALPAPSVLVTVSNGSADFAVQGDVTVTLVEYDVLDRDDVFPEQIDTVISAVFALPSDMPWRMATVRTLQDLRRKAVERMATGWEQSEDPSPDES